MRDRPKTGTVYILKLENNKWYVGYTINIVTRFYSHLKRVDRTEWTKLHTPIEVAQTFDNVEPDVENYITLLLIRKYSFDNVRGGYWHSPKTTKVTFFEKRLKAYHRKYQHIFK